MYGVLGSHSMERNTYQAQNVHFDGLANLDMINNPFGHGGIPFITRNSWEFLPLNPLTSKRNEKEGSTVESAAKALSSQNSFFLDQRKLAMVIGEENERMENHIFESEIRVSLCYIIYV